MNADQLAAHLLDTLDDQQVSRSERRAARNALKEADLRPVERLYIQHALFEGIRERLNDPSAKALLDGLEDVLRILHAPTEQPAATRPPQTCFGPEDPMVETLETLVQGTQRTLDIAVFTLTDDRLSDAVLDRHRRGVKVRILSDNDKSWDRGSDIHRLRDAGVPLRVDASEHHFHHKFAVLDGTALITGSYNWTRGADRNNRENFLVSWDPALVAPYQRAFEVIWAKFET